MMELANFTTNPSRRRTFMDDAFALIREAKRLRQKEPAKANGVGAPKYRVWFHGPLGYLYFDLPMTRRSDALWAAEALAAALSDDYDRYALWNGQTQLFNGPTLHAVFSCRTAVEVSQASQKIVLDAEELALANHENPLGKPAPTRHDRPNASLRDRTPGLKPGAGELALGSCQRVRSHPGLIPRLETWGRDLARRASR